VAVPRVDRRGEPQLHFQARLACDPPHRLGERHLADVGRRVRLITGPPTIAFAIAQRDRQHRGPGVDRRLQQRGMEVLHRSAVGRRALRADRHEAPARERRHDALVCGARVTPAAALDEERADPRHQPADERPALDVGFRHEERRRHRVDREDVEPRDVVRHEQAAVGNEGRYVVGRDAHS